MRCARRWWRGEWWVVLVRLGGLDGLFLSCLEDCGCPLRSGPLGVFLMRCARPGKRWWVLDKVKNGE